MSPIDATWSLEWLHGRVEGRPGKGSRGRAVVGKVAGQRRKLEDDNNHNLPRSPTRERWWDPKAPNNPMGSAASIRMQPLPGWQSRDCCRVHQTGFDDNHHEH